MQRLKGIKNSLSSNLGFFPGREASLLYLTPPKMMISKTRLLQHSGVYPDHTKKPSDLASGRPNVKNVTLLLGQWWGSGIVHTKVWIANRRDVYVGSANNDWKSLTQIKEVGIYLFDCSKIVKKVEIYFENLWKLGSLNSSDYTTVIYDKQWQINRTVPCWSHFVAPKVRCRNVNRGFWFIENCSSVTFACYNVHRGKCIDSLSDIGHE